MKNILPQDTTGTSRGDENYKYLLGQADRIVTLFSKNPVEAESTMRRLVRANSGVTADQWHMVLTACADKWRAMTHRSDSENPFIFQP